MSERHHRLPNANSPQLLTRLLEMVARGVRSTRGLQEALGVEGRTVNYYTQAAQWLGFMDSEDTLSLMGLEYVYGQENRRAVYVRALWTNPHAAELLSGPSGELPSAEEIARLAAIREPDLSPTTLLRRASSVRSLLEPAAGSGRPMGQGQQRQLALPIAVRTTSEEPIKVQSKPGEYDADVYRFVLGALLDYGELALGQLRALLDGAGASHAPIGGYVDLALARADATRVGEHLVVTPGAIRRREVVSNTKSVILSDGGYRAYLAAATSSEQDRASAIRRDELAPRYRSWDERLFGEPLDAANLDAKLHHVLLDRTLGSFPLSGKAEGVMADLHDSFLDVWDREGLCIALPPSLGELRGGLASVNRELRAVVGRPEVAVPDLAVRPSIVHGGLLHPGESRPRSVPDARSLRLRAVMNAPFVTLAVSTLLLHRLRPRLVELVLRHETWELRLRGAKLGEPLSVLDRFASSRGWSASRRVSGGVPFRALVECLERLELAVVVGRHALLAERFFHQLRTEVEEQELHASLAPLTEALEGWLEAEEAGEADGSLV